jgi:FkbM family methyltransferase
LLRSRAKRALYIPDSLASIQQLSKLGFVPRVALDIGAYVGEWSQDLRRVFPACAVAMFEPQPAKTTILQSIAKSMGSAEVFPLLLGGRSSERVIFHLGETGSTYKADAQMDVSQASRASSVEMETTPLDLVVAGTPFGRPDIVKIDVQGAEFDVLEGGSATISHAEVVMIEVSLVKQYPGGKLAHEMIRLMSDVGLLPYDITCIRRNTPSGACNEIDFMFVRASSPLFAMQNYRA